LKKRDLYCILLASFLVFSASACRKKQPAPQQPPTENLAAKVTALADEYIKEALFRYPEQAAFLGFVEAPQDRLTDNSLDALRAWQAKEDRWAAELSGIDSSALWGKPEWLIYGFLREMVEASQATRIARAELWGVNHMSGWQAGFAQLAAIQPVGTPEKRAQALARWRMLPQFIDSEVANLREGLKLGYTAPRLTVRLVIGQLDALLAAPIETSPFFSPAMRDETPEFRGEWQRLLADSVCPAVRRYRDFLDKEYLAGARDSLGVSALPNGSEIYRALFRQSTTLDRPAEETFRLGQEAVQKYESEVAAIGREIIGSSDLDVIRAKIKSDPANYFRDREDLMAFSRDAVERARRAMPQWFLTIPKADVVIEPIPDYLEKTASSGYEPGAADGSRPGTYRINLYQPEKQMRSTMEITAFHETYPGHHFQIAVAMEMPAGHLITRIPMSGGFIEGWARYSEALAEEMGLYSSAYARITRRLWPAHGMVVDPGIHVIGWTREQAIEFVFATGRFSEHEAESLIDRVIATPSQLTSYDTGALEFFALRKKAEAALGPKFDIKAFHDELLKYGSVTLPMLREIIERWVADTNQGAHNN
jgi:uncharacterized protein (DUF885 family)